MNGNRAIKTAGRFGGFCVRHLAALLITVAVPCILWTLAYFAMFIRAAVSEEGGMGSPATYPVGLVLVFVGGSAAAIALFLPSTAIAEWVAKHRGLFFLFQIPISLGILAFLSAIIACAIAAFNVQASYRSFFINWGILFIVHVVPLALYWWVAQSGPILLGVLRRLLARLHR